MYELKQKNFDLRQIAISGQAFRMNEISNGRFEIIARDRYLLAEQDEKGICRFGCSEEEFRSFWYSYFDLETDYGKFISAIDENDAFLTAAAKSCPGLRILRQDPWEMVVTFLISQQNNITRIKRCVENICTRYGEKKTSPDGKVYHAFPLPEALAGLPEDALMADNLGYRSKYVVRTAGEIARGEFKIESLAGMSYEETREKLLKLYGVGVKVADCICLFGLHHIEAFPIDTHIKQMLAREYDNRFPFERYDGFAGVIQQYIFYHELHG